jgi:ubiquinone/menaquinone biosynthesis C-methylase UbiE
MESATEGQRIERKHNHDLTAKQLTWAGVKAGQRVLDLGCAVGTTTRQMAELVGPTGLVVGIDSSKPRLEEARRHPDHRSSIEYRCGQADAIPAGDAEFDLSWSRFLFEYLTDPRKAFSEMVRVTKPGGTVAVSDIDGNCIWHDPMPNEMARELEEAIQTLGHHGFDPNVGRKLYRYAWEAGLREIEVDVRPYHVVAGKVSPEAESLWRLKLETAARTLDGLGWEKGRAEHLVENFLSLLRDEGTFSYSVLISVKGKRL